MPTDTITVHGLEFEASHGYTAAERKLTRRFRCHIELSRDLAAAARSDRVQDTIDYRAVCAIADAIIARFPGTGVTITVEKMAPPCPGAPVSTGVTLTRGISY